MGHGPVKTLGSIVKHLMPGSVVYPLNSQEPLVVVFISEEAVIFNTAEVFFLHRIVRCIGEWERDFPINWEGFLSSDKFEMNCEPFGQEDYQDGLVVIVLSEDRQMAQVAILIGVDDENQMWLTDDLVNIPYSVNDRIIPTGLTYTPEDLPDESNEEECEGET